MRVGRNRVGFGRIAHSALTLAAIAAVVGCASLDGASVEEARRAVAIAEGDPNVNPKALDLVEAKRHLALAEEALSEERFQAVVDHEAYLANRFAKVAVVQAESRLAQQRVSTYLDRTLRATEGTQRAVQFAIRSADALDAERTERGIVLTLGGVLFAFDSAELKPEAQQAVARVAGFLIALNNREVLIEGFTDNIGRDEYNLDLSRRRAENVRAALIENSIDPARILADGFGAAFPVASNEDDAGRSKNRRVEIIILEAGKSAASSRRS